MVYYGHFKGLRTDMGRSRTAKGRPGGGYSQENREHS